MVWISNIIFYNLFRFEKKTQLFFNKMFFLLLKRIKVKKTLSRRGVMNPDKNLINTLENPETGISSILSSAHLTFLYFLLIYGSVNFLSGYLKTEFHLNFSHFIIMFVSSYGFAYWFSFRKNRFLDYFKEFEQFSKIKKIKFVWLTIFIVLSIWVFCISSLIFRIYRF